MLTSQRPEIKTLANLEAAFAGESMAHTKYRYFARIARAFGRVTPLQVARAADELLRISA